MTSQVTFAEDEDNEGKEPPTCSELPNAKSLGRNIESGCRVPAIRNKREAVHPLNKKYENAMAYRYGLTNAEASESWSDLTEDRIKVRALHYARQADTHWQYKDKCADHDEWSSHAACSTPSFFEYRYHEQKGYHQFRSSGFQDDYFSSYSFWVIH